MKKPTKEEIQKLREKHTITEIAKMFGVSRTTIYAWRNDKYKEYKKKYQKEYQKTDKYKKYQKEYQKTDKYKEYRKEYRKTDKYKKYKHWYYINITKPKIQKLKTS